MCMSKNILVVKNIIAAYVVRCDLSNIFSAVLKFFLTHVPDTKNMKYIIRVAPRSPNVSDTNGGKLSEHNHCLGKR